MASGVEVRHGKIRIYFNFDGEKCREPLGIPDTPDNQRYAKAKVDQVRHEIKIGQFDYAKHFPNSKKVEQNRLATWMDDWLAIKLQRVADSTHRGYRNIVRKHLKPAFGDKQIDTLDRVTVEKWISSDLANLASKSIKEAMAVLRQLYSFIRTRHPQITDPTAGINVTMPDDDDPEPFTRDEIDAILNTPPRQDRIQELNLIKFMLWSGPRVSEAIPLAWEDVDLEKGVVKFQRARVRGKFKTTKTKRSTRVHELVAPAREALQAQWLITGGLPAQTVDVKQRDNRTIKREKLHFVFLNTNTGQPHFSDHTLRDRFFKAHLARADVRYRGPGQCRHTYISQMLTAGMDLQWISKQTGTGVEMIRRRYGKWIEDDAPDMIGLAEKRLGLSK